MKYRFVIGGKDESKQAFKSARKNARGFKKELGSFKGLFAGGLGLLAFREIIRATAEQEEAVAQLNQALKTTQGIAGLTSKELQKMATTLQGVTTFGDEEFLIAQAQLLSFTQIQNEEFGRTLEVAADLSVRFGTDLKSSVLQLGKALNDPIANLSALSRSGIQFSTAQKDVIKALVKTGELAKAQKIILGELEVQFGGSARAARNTFGGALKGLKNEFGDLLEGKSGLKSAAAGIEELTALFADPEFKANVDTFVSGLISGFAALASGITKTAGLMADFGTDIAEAIHGNSDPMDILKKQIDEVRDKMQDFDITVKDGVQGTETFLAGFLPLSKSRLDEYKALVQQEHDLMNAFGQIGTDNTRTVNGGDGGLVTPEEGEEKEDGGFFLDGLNEQIEASVALVTSKMTQLRELKETESLRDFERLQFDLLTEREQLMLWHEEKLQLITDQAEREGGLSDKLTALKLKQEKSFQTKSLALKKKEKADGLGALQGALGQNKKYGTLIGNVIQKDALKNAAIKTHEGAISAYDALAGIPYIGPALGAAAAAAVYAFGAKSQLGISSGSKGKVSVSAPPSISQSAPPERELSPQADSNPELQSRIENTYVINVSDNSQSIGEQVREFVDGGGEIIPVDSRQQEQITGG